VLPARRNDPCKRIGARGCLSCRTSQAQPLRHLLLPCMQVVTLLISATPFCGYAAFVLRPEQLAWLLLWWSPHLL